MPKLTDNSAAQTAYGAERVGSSPLRRDRWLLAAVSASLIVLIAIVAISYSQISNQFAMIAGQRESVSYSRALIDGLTLIERLHLEAHAGVRLYTMSGNRNFIGSLDEDSKELPQEFAKLKKVIRVGPAVERLLQLQTLLESQLKFQQQIVAEYDREGHPFAGLDQMRKTSAANVLEARAFIRNWRDSELAALSARDQIEYAQLKTARRYALASLVVGATLIFILGWVLVRYIRRRDLSERRLATTSELLNDIFSSVVQGIAVYDRKARLSSWNARYLELIGVIDPTLIRAGMPIGEVFSVSMPLRGIDMQQMALQARHRLINPSGQIDFSAELTREDGMVLQVTLRSMVRDSSVATMTDVTAIRRSEQIARDHATRLNAIMDNVPDAIVTINASGSIESWSEGAHHLFGYTAEEILRCNVGVLMNEPHSSAHDEYLSRYLNSSAPRLSVRRREFEARHKDGHSFPIDLGVSEMGIGGQRLFVGIIHDITERRVIEQMKSEFVSTVSHELRTPLTSIAGALTLLASAVRGELPPKAQRLLNIANKNSERLTLLINDILDLEKVASGKLELRLRPQHLAAVVAHALEANRAYAAQFGVRFSFQSDLSDPLVLCDESRILQVLTNYLSNAAKFSPFGGEVKVQLARHDRVVRVSVHDNGQGVPNSFRHRIFMRFAQADGSDSRPKGGTGLGLAIAKSLVERHGGAVGFASGQSAVGSGQGATFWFELPTVPDESPTRDQTAPPNTGQVLLCEDDPDAAQMLTELLERLGCVVIVVHNGATARQALRLRNFDLMLVDIHLPDEDGLALIAGLREDSSIGRLPIIVVSAVNCSDAERGSLAALQVLDWMQKPIDPARLHAALASALKTATAGMPCLLHVAADESVVAAVRVMFEGIARIEWAPTLAVARQALILQRFVAIILDVQLPDGSGTELLAEPSIQFAQLPVVVHSATEASGEIASLVQAALIKSHDSLDKLKETIAKLLLQVGNEDMR